MGPVVAVCNVGFGDRADNGSLFHEPAEKEPTATRGASVEPERELLQVRLQVGRNDGALVGTEDPPLKQAGDSVHAWHGDVGRIAL